MEISDFQKEHIHIYQNFIHNKDKVVSLPIINKRTNYIKHSQNWIHIFSSSQLRIYISFQKRLWTIEQHGHIFSFDKKTWRKKSIQTISKHPRRKIDFLIETNIDNIDYRDEIEEYINNYLNDTLIDTKNKSVISFLFQQKTIGFSIIHKNKNQLHHYNIKNILDEKDILWKQLIFSYKKTKKEKIYQQLYSYQPPAIKNLIDLYNNNKGRSTLHNYISQRTLWWIIKTIQGETLEDIFQEFNKQQTVQNKLLQIKTVIPHSIIQHNKSSFSVLIPRYLSQSAQQEFIKEIEYQLKANYLLTQANTFKQQNIFQLEHRPSQKIYSPRYKPKIYYLYNLTWKKYTKKEEIPITKKTYNSVDIMINTIENKIYIWWKKLTSKELHSQSMTIELLTKLLQQPKQTLYNQDLTPSSYSKNKNDMNSKIIIPLKRVIKKRLGKALQLSCMWQLHHFFIERDPNNIKIAIVQQNS